MSYISMIGSVIAPIASKLSDYIFPPITDRFGYLFHYNKNVKNIRELLEKLQDKRSRVQGRVHLAKRNGELIESDVERWLSRVGEVVEKLGKFLEDDAIGEKRSCFNVCCLHLCSSYKLSKEAKKEDPIVAALLQDGDFGGGVSHPAPHPGIAPTAFKTFESRMPVMEEIMEVLKKDEFRMIGIHGIGGVGKTTIAKEVFARAKKDELFEEVVMAVVSQAPKIREIQGQIADLLDLKFSEETEAGRAGRLHARLNGKRVLVILDDVWSGLDLATIGIPFGNDFKGCKIMFTSRDKDVCTEMKTQKDFFINVLSDEEAWSLFREIVGDVLETIDLRSIATQVAKECGGLPIAIITVGNALKKKGIHGWKDALHLLKDSAPRNIKGMHGKVYANIELSYNSLESEEAKSCFLLGCLFTADTDIVIEQLVIYAIGLRLFENVNTFEDERNRTYSLIYDLKASGLLSDSKHVGCVRMHDVIRDVGLFIASKGKHIFMAKAGAELKAWRPRKDTLTPYTGISLMFNDGDDLPQSLECPKLQLLSLLGNFRSLRIPETVFKGMTELSVLDMSNILSPPSFGFMANLRTLRLNHCNLDNVSILGELKSLEILSFSNSSIRELPSEIGQLTCLRLLDLDSCHELEVIQPGIISSLSQLEELYMGDTSVCWEIEEEGRKRSNASFVELESLSNLIILDIHVPDVKLLGKSSFFRNLVRFRLSVDSHFNEKASYLFSATLRLKLDMGIPLQYGLLDLLGRTEDLCLDGLKDLKNILYELDRKGFRLLKYLKIFGCHDVENIIDTMQVGKYIAFPCLEKLYVQDLEQLKSICCHGQLPEGSFGQLSVLEVFNCPLLQVVFDLTGLLVEKAQTLLFSQLTELRFSQLHTLKHMWKGTIELVSLKNLTIVEVERCDALEDLFSPSIARTLVHLQLLIMDKCKMIKEIFSNESAKEVIGEISLPQLNSLKLRSLPNIISFWPMVNQSAQQVTRQPLFNAKVSFPNLEKLELTFMDNLKEIWSAEVLPTSLYQLRVLVVIGCCALLKIAQTNLLQSFHNLELLEVRSCDSLREVFDIEILEIKQEEAKFALLRLREIKLINLPTLKHLWSHDAQGVLSLRNLTILEVRNCGCQENLFSSSVGRTLVQLKEIRIIKCKFLEEIIAKAKGEEASAKEIVFPQVRSLVLENLPSLTSFSPECCIFEWPSLKKLRIAGCYKLASFAPSDLDLTVSKQQLFNDKVAFPELEELILGDMENIIEIWHKQIPVLSFLKLLELKVVCFPKLLSVGPSSFLQRLRNLETLTIEDCSSLEEMFDTEELDIEEGYAKPLSRLRDLTLLSLPRLMHLWSMDSKVYMGFQSLSTLTIDCCDSLVSIFSPSIAGVLVQLYCLDVRKSKKLREVIARGRDGEIVEKIVFPNIKVISLGKLASLTAFCNGSYSLDCPLLEALTLKKCSQIDKFTAEKVGITNNGLEVTHLEGNLDVRLKHIFNEKITLPRLTELKLSYANNLREIWHGKLPIGSFCKLWLIEVEDCHQLMSIVPSNLLQRLQQLERLYVARCPSLVKVFDFEGLNVVDRCAELRNLKELTLQHLAKLTYVCHGVPPGFQGFQNLGSLNIENCDSLRFVFPASVAKCLVQLQSLTIITCNSMKEIVVEEEVVDIIEFRCLDALVLKDLPNLMSFCLGNCTLEWPSLRQLTIDKCPQLKSFPSRFQSTQKLRGTYVESEETVREADLNISVQYLFNEKVSFPSLEEFNLNFVNLNDICHSLPSLSLCKLRTLWAENCDKLLSVVTSSTLESLHNLQDLVVQCCGSLAVVFDLEGIVVEDEHVPPLSMLKKLVLRELPVLKHILKKGPTVKAVFQNLKTLKLHDCDSLQNLFPISIFRGIARLQKLDVRRCKMMEEIITKEEGDVVTANMIEFPELDSITLKSLPKLISFFPRKYTLKCPSLNAIWVKDCPKMKSICGHEGSKKLVRMQAGLDEWLWRSASCNTFEFFSLNNQYVAMELVVESDTEDTLAGVSISNDYLGETDNQEKVTHLKEMSITASAPRGNGEEPPQEVPQGAPSSNIPKTGVTSVKEKGIATSSGNKQSQHNKTTTITITELAILESDTSDNSDKEANFSTQPEVGRRANREEGSTSKATLIQG
ncbi:uncharacterized protein LOC114261269 isoform X2 [Camellia sinensis]|uniref:uncharacterized protein LOC114261269 isoform X2 n=1 Tax=Camellia sinensis TaxID=4442 RepID=UPI0010357B73|nr:uncharacterized protein LOC114261269 isoform X2 [Camellia sinensis]